MIYIKKKKRVHVGPRGPLGCTRACSGPNARPFPVFDRGISPFKMFTRENCPSCLYFKGKKHRKRRRKRRNSNGPLVRAFARSWPNAQSFPAFACFHHFVQENCARTASIFRKKKGIGCVEGDSTVPSGHSSMPSHARGPALGLFPVFGSAISSFSTFAHENRPNGLHFREKKILRNVEDNGTSPEGHLAALSRARGPMPCLFPVFVFFRRSVRENCSNSLHFRKEA